MKTAKPQVSEFARALKGLLDGPQVYSRADWALLLDVSQAAISQWLTDRTLPRAEILRQIVDEVESSSATPVGVLEEFWRVAARPAREVSPLAARIDRTFGHYVITPLTEGFQRVFHPLTPQEQTAVIMAAGDLCTDFNRARARRREQGIDEPLGPLVHGVERGLRAEDVPTATERSVTPPSRPAGRGPRWYTEDRSGPVSSSPQERAAAVRRAG